MANFSMNLPSDLAAALKQKAREAGMTESQLVRLSIASFLAKENALDDYLTAIGGLDEKISTLTVRQEQFARAVGMTAMTPEAEKTAGNRQKFADRITQITETVS